MKLQVQIEVNTHGGETPLLADVETALRKQLPYLLLSWNDPSLGRVIEARLEVVHVSELPTK